MLLLRVRDIWMRRIPVWFEAYPGVSFTLGDCNREEPDSVGPGETSSYVEMRFLQAFSHICKASISSKIQAASQNTSSWGWDSPERREGMDDDGTSYRDEGSRVCIEDPG